MTARCLLALTLAAAVGSQGAAQDTPAAAFTLVPTTLTLAPGQTARGFNVIVLAKGLTPDKTRTVTPTLTDHAGAAFPGVKVETRFASTSDATAADQRWTFEVEVSDFPPSDHQQRTFLVEYGNVRHSVTYTLTNQAGKTFTWSVKAAGDWNAASMKSLGLAIKVGDLPATGVTLGTINLMSEDKRKVTLGTEHLKLCSNESGTTCDAIPTLEARAPVTLHLRSSNLPVGSFKGTIAITAREKADAETLQLTIYSPRSGWQWYGFFALAAGTLVSLIVQVLVRPLFQRLRERQAKLQLRKSVEDMKTELATFPAELRRASGPWSADADELLKDIEKIPVRPRIPMPFDEEIAGLTTFKSAVEACTPKLLHLRLRFREGLLEVRKLLTPHATKPDAVAAAAEAAEAISLEPEANDAATKIAGHLNDLRKKLKELPKVVLAGARRSTADELATIAFQLSAASIVVWLFWGLVSVATGMVLLVYSNPAFGTPVDWWTCFLWALGVSVVGQQASQLTPGGIATSVGIKFPVPKND